jgi:hypothetical protein
VGVLARAGGAALVVLALADVFFTVLAPGTGHGPLRRPLSRLVWGAFRQTARALPRTARRRLLLYSGPTLIVVTIATWFASLTVGWALVYLPSLGRGLARSQGTTPHGFAAAFYYSGFSVTTLGTGDIAPQDALHRVLTVLEAAVGFAVVTMVVTYFLSVYNAITSRRTFAAALDHRTFGTGDSAQLVAGLAHGDDLSGVLGQLAATGQFLQDLYETHRAYPVLRYFHYRRVRYSLPRMLFLTLDAAALLVTALDDHDHRGVARSPALALVNRAAQELLDELVPQPESSRPDQQQEGQWRARFASAVEELERSGLSVTRDPGAADAYVDCRRHWDASLRVLADVMLYDWAEIEARTD